MTDRELDRRAAHRLAVIRHADAALFGLDVPGRAVDSDAHPGP